MKAGIFSRVLDLITGRAGKSKPKIAKPLAQTYEKERRAPRFSLQDFTGLYQVVHLTLAGDDARYVVADLSAQGLRFESLAKPSEALLGRVIPAVLHLGELDISFMVCPVRIKEHSVGCSIVRSADWHDKMGKFLDPMETGRSMYEINPEYVQQTQGDRQVRWFHSPPSSDLYLWSEVDGTLDVAQLFFGTQVAEWSRAHGLRTGAVVGAAREKGMMGYAASETFNFHPKVDKELLKCVYRLLGASPVSREVRVLFKKA